MKFSVETGAFSLFSSITIGPMEVVSFTFIGAFPFGVQLEGEGAASAACARGTARAMARGAKSARRGRCMEDSLLGADDRLVDDAPVGAFARPELALEGAFRKVVGAVVLLEAHHDEVVL